MEEAFNKEERAVMRPNDEEGADWRGWDGFTYQSLEGNCAPSLPSHLKNEACHFGLLDTTTFQPFDQRCIQRGSLIGDLVSVKAYYTGRRRSFPWIAISWNFIRYNLSIGPLRYLSQ